MNFSTVNHFNFDRNAQLISSTQFNFGDKILFVSLLIQNSKISLAKTNQNLSFIDVIFEAAKLSYLIKRYFQEKVFGGE
jgi:hypothetical protein